MTWILVQSQIWYLNIDDLYSLDDINNFLDVTFKKSVITLETLIHQIHGYTEKKLGVFDLLGEKKGFALKNTLQL